MFTLQGLKLFKFLLKNVKVDNEMSLTFKHSPKSPHAVQTILS